jgi:RNA polymerase sigma factor (sigma-70 family)
VAARPLPMTDAYTYPSAQQLGLMGPFAPRAGHVGSPQWTRWRRPFPSGPMPSPEADPEAEAEADDVEGPRSPPIDCETPKCWPDDLSLVRAARAGDQEALRVLSERIACLPAMVRGRDRRLGGNLTSHQVEEVVQETVLALWTRLDRYDGSSPLEAWAYGFVVRKHYKACRRPRRDPSATYLLELAESGEQPRIAEEAEYRALHDAVQALAPPTPEIIHLRHFDELSFEGIADQLDLPVNTVKTRYYRGLRKLRTHLQPMWNELWRESR